MRVLAPGVVLTTLALFATGVALLIAGPDERLPQASCTRRASSPGSR